MIYFDMLEGVHDNSVDCEDSIDSSETLTEAQEVGLDTYYTLLSEAYIGKTQETLKIEQKIEEIRNKYSTKQMKINTAPEREQLEDLFCEAFGFACCSIMCKPSPLYNVCTIPVSSIIFDFKDYNSYLDISNKKIKYKKSANVYVIIQITKGLLFSDQFTAGEVTAILLHEVGHNFQTAISGKAKSLNMINKIFNVILSPILLIAHPSVGPFRNQYVELIKKVNKDWKGAADAYWAVNNFLTTIVGIGIGALGFLSNISMMMNPIAVLQQIPQKILNKLNLDIIFLPSGIKGEAVSDAFATMYGYGPELASALKKIEKASGGYLPDQITRDTFLGTYFDLITLPNKIIFNIFDPHPNTIARLKSQYDYINEELSKGDYNPKMKKELQKQLKEIDATMNKFLDAEDSGFFFSNQYDKVMLMMFGGDLRSGLAKGTNEEIDQAQARAEKQLEEIKSKK